jgi:hypothetical protein
VFEQEDDMERRYDVESSGDPMIFGDIERWRRAKLYDKTGDEIGEIDDVFVDEESDRPEWVQVKTGLLGRAERLIPILAFQRTEGGFIVPFTKEEVKDSPEIDEEVISLDEEKRLYSHYGVEISTEESRSQLPASGQGRARDEAGSEGLVRGPAVGNVIPTSTSEPGTYSRDEYRGENVEARRDDYIGVETDSGDEFRSQPGDARSGALPEGGREQRLRPPSELTRASRMRGRRTETEPKAPEQRRDHRAA